MTTPRRGDLFSPDCPTRWLLDRISGKWVVMIVRVLGDRELRYAELKRGVPGVSARMLARTLRSLEEDRLVTRRVEPTVPPAVHYALTPLGRSLAEPLRVLQVWAEEHVAEIDGLAPGT